MSKIITNEKEKETAAARYAEWFSDPAKIPVSFRLGNEVYHGFGEGFSVTREPLPAGTQVGTPFDGLRRYRSLSDRGEKITAKHPSGITVTVMTAVYENYGTFEWAVYFRNEGTENSPVLSEVNAADLSFGGQDPCLHYFIGDDSEDRHAMKPESILLRPGISFEIQPFGGRPTNFMLPFFRLSTGEETAVISVGWSGQWRCRFDTVNAISSVRMSAGQVNLHAYLTPGEEIRTPMMTFLFADCRCDCEAGEDRVINLWRRFLIDCNMRLINGELMKPHTGASTSWIYAEMRDATDANQIAAFDVYRENGIKPDYWWMDAGWYFKGDHELIDNWTQTGSWEIDTNRFPSEMRDITTHVEKYGSKTLLWFEPERITENTFLAGKPEWQVTPSLLDLGNPEARAWLSGRVNSVLKKAGISIYRQDYNIDPLDHWLRRDSENAPDRWGITENHYVTGYLAYWDSLIAENPEMMLDSCASGGRRNDLETVRRSVSLHKTDADYSDFTRKQAMHYSFYQWLPYFGTPVTGAGYTTDIEKYAFRSAMIPWFTYSYDVRKSAEENAYEPAAEALEEWHDTNMFFWGDYYPLTGWSNSDSDWIGWEFYDDEQRGGIIQLFRRDSSEEDMKTFVLRGLDPNTTYVIHDYDGDPVSLATGRELCGTGITVVIPEKRSSALIKFTARK